MPHFRSSIILLFGTLGLLVACWAGTSALPGAVQPGIGSETPAAGEESPAPPVTLRVVTGHPPGSLDPALVSLSDTAGYDLVENLYVGLTQLDPDTNSVQPALATTWTVSPDKLRWDFELRDDVMWVAFDPALGAVTALRPVTADDVVYAIWRACHPATNAPYAATLFVIRGCREINNTDPALITEQTLADTIRALAIDPTSLSVELEEEAAYFLSLTTMPIMRPVAPEAFAEDGTEWRDAGQRASSGPWVVVEERPGQGVTLVANPKWPLARGGNVTAVEVQFAPDETAAYAAFQAGEADIAPLPGEQAGSASLMRVEPRVSFLAFAADQFPMDDVRVRRALAVAIDRQRVVDKVLGGNGFAGTGFAPPGTVGVLANAGASTATYDPDYAQAQMAAAGYPRCQLFPVVTLLTDQSAQSLALAQAYVEMWQNNLGCNDTRFDIQQGDMRMMLEWVNTPLAAEWQTRPHIIALTWQADYPDANNWLGDVLHCERGYLQLGRPCEVVDDLIDRAAHEYNPDARAVLYTEIEALLFGEDGPQPIAPIYADVQPLAVQPWLTVPTGTPPLTSGPARYDRWQLDSAARP